MADLRVRCINKVPRDDPHHGIINLGGENWKYTRQQVVDFIKSKTHSFHTLDNGKRAEVGVRQTPQGHEYVQTYADGYWNNNLLALLECR